MPLNIPEADRLLQRARKDYDTRYGEVIKVKNEELTVIGTVAGSDKIMVCRNNGVRAYISRKAYEKGKCK